MRWLTSLTEQQGLILEVSGLVRRMEIRGGAGSGKTWMAVEQAPATLARRASESRCCATRADWLPTCARHVDIRVTAPTAAGPGTSVRFTASGHLGAHRWLPQATTTVTTGSNGLPAQMTSFWPVSGLQRPGKRFDAIVIDEAQDFADEWWPAVLAALKDQEETGRNLTVYSDEGQRVFARFGGNHRVPRSSALDAGSEPA